MIIIITNQPYRHVGCRQTHIRRTPICSRRYPRRTFADRLTPTLTAHSANADVYPYAPTYAIGCEPTSAYGGLRMYADLYAAYCGAAV